MFSSDPGGSASPLTSQTVTAIRAVDLMAEVRGKLVFVMALQCSQVRQ